MGVLRGEEAWAAKMIEAAVGAPVRQHDDGTRPSMYDLEIVYPGRPAGAVEVTAAGDEKAIEHWNQMNAQGRWVVDTLLGGWMVSVRVGSSWRRLEKALPGLLAELEQQGRRSFSVQASAHGRLEAAAERLGIAFAQQSGTGFPGSIYLTIDMPADRAGGMVPAHSNALATWLGDFLREPKPADVLQKLGTSSAEERHAFVFLPGFNTAPFAVNDLLLRPEAPVPTAPPDLPEPVTHVWAVSSWTTGAGFRWAPNDGWSAFEKCLDGAGAIAI